MYRPSQHLNNLRKDGKVITNVKQRASEMKRGRSMCMQNMRKGSFSQGLNAYPSTALSIIRKVGRNIKYSAHGEIRWRNISQSELLVVNIGTVKNSPDVESG